MLDSVIRDLVDYSSFHFQEQEKLMVQSGLDHRHLVQHFEAHKSFLSEVLSIKSTLSPENLGMAKYLLEFLTHWPAYHILGMDLNIARQLSLLKSLAQSRHIKLKTQNLIAPQSLSLWLSMDCSRRSHNLSENG